MQLLDAITVVPTGSSTGLEALAATAGYTSWKIPAGVAEVLFVPAGSGINKAYLSRTASASTQAIPTPSMQYAITTQMLQTLNLVGSGNLDVYFFGERGANA
jgi:hypothetical protein